jgi:hypothetical protein
MCIFVKHFANHPQPLLKLGGELEKLPSFSRRGQGVVEDCI